MKTGRSKYLTKQAGEYLVAAELSRRGYIATTFTGNLPYYDIIAVDDCGGHAVVLTVKLMSTPFAPFPRGLECKHAAMLRGQKNVDQPRQSSIPFASEPPRRSPNCLLVYQRNL
jgi:hypothetical protein